MSPKNPYQAYHRATHTVSKTRQVVMLYEGILRNLTQAREAIKENKIEERYHKLVRANEIVMGLQMSLDFSQGEEAAQALFDFYAMLDKRIIKAQRTNDVALCEQMITDVRAMREVWLDLDRNTHAAPANASAHTGAHTTEAATPAASQPTAAPNMAATTDTAAQEKPASGGAAGVIISA